MAGVEINENHNFPEVPYLIVEIPFPDTDQEICYPLYNSLKVYEDETKQYSVVKYWDNSFINSNISQDIYMYQLEGKIYSSLICGIQFNNHNV